MAVICTPSEKQGCPRDVRKGRELRKKKKMKGTKKRGPQGGQRIGAEGVYDPRHRETPTGKKIKEKKRRRSAEKHGGKQDAGARKKRSGSV